MFLLEPLKQKYVFETVSQKLAQVAGSKFPASGKIWIK
jgi:hypothetical protein